MMDARKAIEQISELADAIAYGESEANALAILDICAEVLNKPPRNCDVGNAEEQAMRFEHYCSATRTMERCCLDCPLVDCPWCEFAWAQTPYDAEEKGECK